MKGFLYITLAFFSVLFLVILSGAAYVFYKPQVIINTANLEKALHELQLFNRWSWESATIKHELVKWNERKFNLNLESFCFDYESETVGANSCLDVVSIKLDFGFNTKDGFFLKRPSPVVINSKLLSLNLKDTPANQPVKQAQEEDGIPLDVKDLWDLLWHRLIPEIYIHFDKIAIAKGDDIFELNLDLKKIEKELQLNSLGINLSANPNGLQIKTPKNFELPFKVPVIGSIFIESFIANANIDDEEIKIFVDTKALGAEVKVNSKIDLPLSNPPSSPEFIKSSALNTKFNVVVEEVAKKTTIAIGPPYNELPAPLNALEGALKIEGGANSGLQKNEIEIYANANSDMAGAKQFLNFDVNGKMIFDVKDYKLGAMLFDVNLNKVILKTPNMPKNALPPQFGPDGRIYTESPAFESELAQKQVEDEPLDLNMRLKGLERDSLGIITNLIEHIIRFNFDLIIERGKLKGGYVRILPLDTEFFNRDIKIKKFVISFDQPLRPEINGEILFDLPEYKVHMFLEGPISNPRHALRSEPPLPEEDIYSVLLFGRPMLDLEGGEKDAAQKTNKVLSQGLLSIGVLYFLSDTPIQAIMYDPDSEKVSAQFGLTDKSALTVEKGGVGIRQSIGKGWYVNTTSKEESGYGVMLERILAY